MEKKEITTINIDYTDTDFKFGMQLDDTLKIVIINEATNYNFFAIMIHGSSNSSVFPGTDAGDVMDITLTWSNKSVSWYGQSAAQWQLNRSGKVYNWVAIG